MYMFVSLFVILFNDRRPSSVRPPACCLSLVFLCSSRLVLLASLAVLNTVITNVQRTVKNYMSLNYDCLRFSGSVEEDHIIATLWTWHAGYRQEIVFKMDWLQSCSSRSYCSFQLNHPVLNYLRNIDPSSIFTFPWQLKLRFLEATYNNFKVSRDGNQSPGKIVT
jgi:hypothetical protein